jgi:hypothetical protein
MEVRCTTWATPRRRSSNDDVTLQVGPNAGGVDRAREQFARARAIAVPDGFIRVVHEYTGFEDDGG